MAVESRLVTAATDHVLASRSYDNGHATPSVVIFGFALFSSTIAAVVYFTVKSALLGAGLLSHCDVHQ